jgi:hypothetical protein
MTKSEIIPILVHAILSGGFLGGIYLLLKLRPEAGQITVTAAQGAIIVQTGVIDTLREELIRLREETEALREENIELRKRIKELERANE